MGLEYFHRSRLQNLSRWPVPTSMTKMPPGCNKNLRNFHHKVLEDPKDNKGSLIDRELSFHPWWHILWLEAFTINCFHSGRMYLLFLPKRIVLFYLLSSPAKHLYVCMKCTLSLTHLIWSYKIWIALNEFCIKIRSVMNAVPFKCLIFKYIKSKLPFIFGTGTKPAFYSLVTMDLLTKKKKLHLWFSRTIFKSERTVS